MEPFLFVSYGMTKTGSTLAFQLARVALIQAGYPQPLLKRAGEVARKFNFVPVLNENRAARFLEQIDAIGHPIVLKTHSPAEATAARLLAEGRLRAHAAYRDLRDMALSMRDHGTRARAAGKPAFAEIETLADARRGIEDQLQKLHSWLALPGVAPMPYDRVAFETEAAAADVLDQLGIDGEPRRIAARVLGREFTQRNKAVPQRHETEMDPSTSRAFLDAYAPFYDALMRPRPQLPLAPDRPLVAAETPVPNA